MSAIIHLIGAPTDVGASVRGAGMGPDALRVAQIAETLAGMGLRVIDGGNLTGPTTPWASSQQGLRHLDEVVAWNRAVHEAVSIALTLRHVPVLMGGDHSLAVGAISAVARHVRQQGRTLRVLWLDAHADINTENSTPSGNLHGMPVACLLGQGPAALMGWSGEPATLTPQMIRLLGIRSVDAEERRAIRARDLTVFDMRHIDESGMRITMNEALQGVDENTHLHLSFDLDCLDPDYAPGVGTPVRGGPSYREMQLCMEMIADTGRLGSVDVMELNPALDEHNRTAEVAVELIASLFGQSTLARVSEA